jgi:hypothetical protein
LSSAATLSSWLAVQALRSVPFWKVLARQAVDVFIAAALPRRMRIGEVDLQSGRLLDALVLKHLVALVPGQRPTQLNRQFAERDDERVSDGRGGVVSSYRD